MTLTQALEKAIDLLSNIRGTDVIAAQVLAGHRRESKPKILCELRQALDDAKKADVGGRRYRITLVGSEEPNGSRTITTEGGVMFAVEPKYMITYTPNAGDTLVRDHDGEIRFE